jgi:23S rRNA (guanine745-N1)-methyltransferase
MFKCPHCNTQLTQNEHTWVCQNKHSFDISKQGYTNLFLSNSARILGDHPDMIKARHIFLEAGHYAFLRDALVDIFAQLKLNHCVDLGCGEGYYTNVLAESQTQWVALDLSKAALKIASRASKVTYFCASIADTPLMNQSMDGALCIFAPYVLDEVLRIVKPNGYFITVSPGSRHLFGLKAALYDEVHLNPETHIDDPRLQLLTSKTLSQTLHLNSSEMIQNLLTMTPYRFKTSSFALNRLRQVESLETELSFIIDIYQVH